MFKTIEVELEDLLGWSTVSGIQEEIAFEGGRVRRPGSLSAEFPEERTVRIADPQVTLHHGFRTGSDHKGVDDGQDHRACLAGRRT